MKSAVLAIVASAQAELVPVPGGHAVDRACIVEVEPNTIFNADDHKPNPECATPILGDQFYAADVHLKSSEPLTSFTADWVVPALPAQNAGQVVYFWPGFKAEQPEIGLPVLQPVLQFGQYKDWDVGYWELQCWFVNLNNKEQYHTATSKNIRVFPGDKITSYMSLSADGSTWTVYGRDLTTGQETKLQIDYSKAGNTNYDYAMLVNENINVDKKCSLMPQASEVVFTNVTVNGKVPSWTTRAGCKGNKHCDCGNSAVVDAADHVHLGWNAGVVV